MYSSKMCSSHWYHLHFRVLLLFNNLFILHKQIVNNQMFSKQFKIIKDYNYKIQIILGIKIIFIIIILNKMDYKFQTTLGIKISKITILKYKMGYKFQTTLDIKISKITITILNNMVYKIQTTHHFQIYKILILNSMVSSNTHNK